MPYGAMEWDTDARWLRLDPMPQGHGAAVYLLWSSTSSAETASPSASLMDFSAIRGKMWPHTTHRQPVLPLEKSSTV
jgi:hypothetical protein